MIINKLPINRFVVIGSYPLNTRYSKDIDIVCYKKDIQCDYIEKDNFSGHFDFEGRRIELLFADEQESFIELLSKHHFENSSNLKSVATLEQLYSIKRGHIVFPSKNWDKHISDLHVLAKMMPNYGIEYLNTSCAELIKLHRKSTEYRLGKKDKTPKLNGVTKEEFFDDNVIYYYEHDSIHELFAHREKPSYTYMQLDPNLVACSKELWNKFTYQQQVETVLEEAMVIASERQIIPTLKGATIGLRPHDAFKWALMRICTTLCGGFFRNFALDNYFEILNNYNREYYKKLEQLN